MYDIIVRMKSTCDVSKTYFEIIHNFF